MSAAMTNLSIKDAKCVKTAEEWLRLGKPSQALMELQRLTKRAWKNPWTENIIWRAAQAMH